MRGEMQQLRFETRRAVAALEKVKGTYDTEMVEVIRSLKRADVVRQNMQTCASVLQQIESWHVRVQSLERHVMARELEQAATCIQELQQSLEVSRDLPVYPQRAEELNRILGEFDVVLSTLLAQAILNHDIASFEQSVQLYCATSMSDRLVTRYTDAVSGTLQLETEQDKHWVDATGSRIVSILDQQKPFLDLLTLNKVEHALQCLVEALALVFQSRIKEWIPSQQWDTMRIGFDAVCRFIGTIKEKMQSFSIEHDHLISLMMLPYRDFFRSKYAVLEEGMMQGSLEPIALSDSVDDLVRAFESSSKQVLAAVEAAVDRCLYFSRGTALPTLHQSITSVFRIHSKHVQTACRHLETIVQQRSESHVESCFQLYQAETRFRSQVGHVASSVDHKVLQVLHSTLDGDETIATALLPQSERRLARIRAFATGESCLVDATALTSLIHDAIASVLFVSMVSPLRQLIQDLHSWESWNRAGKEVISQPSEVLHTAGDHLFTLAQQLEIYCSNDIELVLYWLSRVYTTLMQELFQKIGSIPAMSTRGIAQLRTDIEYLQGIAQALGLASLEYIETLQRALQAATTHQHIRQAVQEAELSAAAQTMQ